MPALRNTPPPQLLKWIGNKQRFAPQIVESFPRFTRYYEPFLGSGAVLGALAPQSAVASDLLGPLIEIWQQVVDAPEELIASYDRYRCMLDAGYDKRDVYAQAKDAFNRQHDNSAFIYLTRACYGGVIRFRKADGAMSTPVGAHTPISTETFAQRVYAWRNRVSGTEFKQRDYKDAFIQAEPGSLIYCDPPYVDSQKILYGAQGFDFHELVEAIADAKARGINVALSIDGTKRNRSHNVALDLPDGLFEVEVEVTVGRSMLKRFQANGKTMERHGVTDRLLLTYMPPVSTTAVPLF